MAQKARTAFHPNKGIAEIELSGQLDMYSVKNLREELLDFLQSNQPALKSVQVDMAGVSELDSSGIALLAHIQKKTNEMGAKMTVHKPGPKIRRLFDLGFIDAMFEVVD